MFSVLPGTPSQKREKAGIAGVKKVIFFKFLLFFKLIKNLQPVFFFWVFFLSLFFCFSFFVFVVFFVCFPVCFFKQH